jgi:hypothetical protein
VTLVDLARRISSNGGLVSFPNIGLISFAAFYIPLIGVVSILVVQFPTVWLPYIYMLAYLGGIAAPIAVWKPAFIVSNSLDDYFGTGKLFRGIVVFSVLGLWFQLAQRINPYLSSYSGSQVEVDVQYAAVIFLAFSLGLTGVIGLIFVVSLLMSFIIYLLKNLVGSLQSMFQ